MSKSRNFFGQPIYGQLIKSLNRDKIVEIRKRLLWEMKLMEWPKYSWCSAKESSVLGKRIDDAKRKQSIYSQTSLNCYASGGSNTGPKHRKIIDFPLGFREDFSLLLSCLCGFIQSNTMKQRGTVSLPLRKGMEKLLIPHKEQGP